MEKSISFVLERFRPIEHQRYATAETSVEVRCRNPASRAALLLFRSSSAGVSAYVSLASLKALPRSFRQRFQKRIAGNRSTSPDLIICANADSSSGVQPLPVSGFKYIASPSCSQCERIRIPGRASNQTVLETWDRTFLARHAPANSTEP